MVSRLNSHYFIFLLLPVLIGSACNNKSDKGVILVNPKNFDTIIDGKQVHLYTLRNHSGCVAQFSNFGARWLSMWIPGREGRMRDVVMGFNTLDDYMSAGEPYHGAIVGRVCGRINKARFSLNGIEYSLASNDAFGKPIKNHLQPKKKSASLPIKKLLIFRKRYSIMPTELHPASSGQNCWSKV